MRRFAGARNRAMGANIASIAIPVAPIEIGTRLSARLILAAADGKAPFTVSVEVVVDDPAAMLGGLKLHESPAGKGAGQESTTVAGNVPVVVRVTVAVADVPEVTVIDGWPSESEKGAV